MKLHFGKAWVGAAVACALLAGCSFKAKAQDADNPAPVKRKTARKPAAAEAASSSPADDKKSGKMTARGAGRSNFTDDQKVSFEDEKKNAVLVAPSYLNSGLPALKYNANDALELRKELERQGFKVHIVPSTEATADGIREQLAKEKGYFEGTQQGTLLFAFMGHGFQNDAKKNLLMTYGADTTNYSKEALAVEEVEDLMNQTAARRKIIFIDACRKSLEGTRDTFTPRSMADFKAAEGTAVLLATRPGYFSYEDPELSHGVFTYFLLEGLRGKAAGKDGFVSFGDLTKYVERSVSDYSEKKDQAQKPRTVMQDVGGDFLVATAAPPKPEDIKPNVMASQITSDVPVMRSVSTKQSFYALVNSGTLTLVDAQSGQPFSILNEHPEQMKDQAAISARSLHWYSGNGPDNAALHIVVEMRANNIAQIYGRLGKACPNDQPCSATPYPLLPGEVRDQKAALVNKTKKGALALIGGAGNVLGRKSLQTAQTVANSSAAAEKTGMLQGDRDKFIWTEFDLASTMKLPPPTAGATVAQR